LRRIYRQVRGTPIAPGFLGFIVGFVCIFLWRGSMLYLQVYSFDDEARALGLGVPDAFPVRVALSATTNRVASVLSSLSVGGVFVYLARTLR
jgi:hypothetical protein